MSANVIWGEKNSETSFDYNFKVLHKSILNAEKGSNHFEIAAAEEVMCDFLDKSSKEMGHAKAYLYVAKVTESAVLVKSLVQENANVYLTTGVESFGGKDQALTAKGKGGVSGIRNTLALRIGDDVKLERAKELKARDLVVIEFDVISMQWADKAYDVLYLLDFGAESPPDRFPEYVKDSALVTVKNAKLVK